MGSEMCIRDSCMDRCSRPTLLNLGSMARVVMTRCCFAPAWRTSVPSSPHVSNLVDVMPWSPASPGDSSASLRGGFDLSTTPWHIPPTSSHTLMTLTCYVHMVAFMVTTNGAAILLNQMDPRKGIS